MHKTQNRARKGPQTYSQCASSLIYPKPPLPQQNYSTFLSSAACCRFRSHSVHWPSITGHIGTTVVSRIDNPRSSSAENAVSQIYLCISNSVCIWLHVIFFPHFLECILLSQGPGYTVFPKRVLLNNAGATLILGGLPRRSKAMLSS